MKNPNLRIYSSIAAAAFLGACNSSDTQAQKTEVHARQEVMIADSRIATKVLEKQISLGGNPADWGFNAADEEDLKVSLSLQDSILMQNSYRKSNDFKKKAAAIFHLKNSRWENDPVHLETGFDENINTTQCYESADGFRLAIAQQANNLFVSTQHQLVGNLFLIPQLIDYQRKFPDMITFEQAGHFRNAASKEVQKWKEILDLDKQRNTIVRTIVARNKYLFNDDKSQLGYLLTNDSIFMNALVEIFGYSKDDNLLRAVLGKYDEDSGDFATSGNKLGRILFPKDCNGQVEVRREMLQYIEKNTSANDVRLMFALGTFASSLIIGEDETLNQYYSKEDKRKMVAHIASIYDPAWRIYRTTGNAPWAKVPLLAFLFRRDPGAEQAIKQQQNYQLPRLQELIDFSNQYFTDDFLYK